MRARSTSLANARRRGLSLMELVLVVSVLGVLAALLIPALGSSTENAKQTITAHSLRQLRVAIVDHYYRDQANHLPMPVVSGRMAHPQLVFLYVNPVTGTTVTNFDPQTALGWRGPYLHSAVQQGRYRLHPSLNFTNLYGEEGDLTPLDAWGSPIVVQQVLVGGVYSATNLQTARLVSAGPDGKLDTDDDVVLPLGVTP